jgi:hypothetical protein
MILEAHISIGSGQWFLFISVLLDLIFKKDV